MSEQTQEPQTSLVPQDVVDLQTTAAQLASYRTCFNSATFPGSQAESALNLRNFLNETYQQVLKQFNEHPYVIEARAKQAAQDTKVVNGQA